MGREQERRRFLKQVGFSAASIGLASAASVKAFESGHPTTPPSSESDWLNIRADFNPDPNLINLNHAGVSPQPNVVQQAVENAMRFSNTAPTYYMWRQLRKGKERTRERLAEMLNCSNEEIALTRNATESLETIALGLDLKKGDEVVLSKYDYPTILHCWRQRERREGIRLKYVDLEFPMENEEETTERYLSQCTSKTKLIHLTQIMNWTGQHIPVATIAAQAVERGIEVMVDAAHALGQIETKVSELGCDYLGASLHKWLSCPFGTGVLFVKKSKIDEIWSLFGSEPNQKSNIRKFENCGTINIPLQHGIGTAIDYHESIGLLKKSDRLFELKTHWMEALKEVPEVRFKTSFQRQFSSCIGAFELEHIPASEVAKTLLQKHRIHLSVSKWEQLDCLRISPNIFTTKAELDKLSVAIKEVARSK